MARQIERLSARRVQLAGKPGMHPDGGGLYLRIGPTGAKSWVYRYQLAGRRHDMGIGPYPLVSLADARERTTAQRRLHLDGTDPLTAKHGQRARSGLPRPRR